MLTVGDKFPSYDLTACVSLEAGSEFAQIDHKTYEASGRSSSRGRWTSPSCARRRSPPSAS